jgi:hypothetical protein
VSAFPAWTGTLPKSKGSKLTHDSELWQVQEGNAKLLTLWSEGTWIPFEEGEAPKDSHLWGFVTLTLPADLLGRRHGIQGDQAQTR